MKTSAGYADDIVANEAFSTVKNDENIYFIKEVHTEMVKELLKDLRSNGFQQIRGKQ